MAKILDSGLEVSEVELQSRCLHSLSNEYTWEKY